MNNISLYPYKSCEDCFVLGKKEEVAGNSVNYRKVPRDLYKYCSITTALKILKSQAIRFSIPTCFPDKREGILYSLAKEHQLKDANCFFDHDMDYYTCCFTTAKISEAFTQIYSAQEVYSKITKKNDSKAAEPIKDINGTNINSLEAIKEFIRNDSIGVCFKFNRSRFQKCLLKTLKDKSKEQYQNFKLIEGYMQYYSPTTIDNITSNSSQELDKSEFDYSFCNLLTCKNRNFKYEEEFRFFVGLKRLKEEKEGFSINFNECLDNIFIFMHSKFFSQEILESIKNKIFEVCKSVDIQKEEDELIKIINIYDTDFSKL